jgi:hypothetical protein
MNDQQEKQLAEFLARILPMNRAGLREAHAITFPGVNNFGRKDSESLTANELRSDLIIAKVHQITNTRRTR